MANRKEHCVAQWLASLGGLFAAPAVFADWQLNMPEGVTPLSRNIFGLHMTIFWVCVAIAAVVFGAMIYSIFVHRRSRGAESASFSHSTKAEIIWTAIPIAILIVMAIPAANSLVSIEDTRNPDMSIQVTGYQWKWHYRYLDNDISFFSNLEAKANRARQTGSGFDPFEVDHYLRDVDNYLVVPVNKKVRLLLTSNDVIHAWWVPKLGGKRDAIPGFVNQLWFQAEQPGIYRGQCAELCGRDHGFMPIVVDVRSEADYAAWVGEQTSGAQAVRLAASMPDAAAAGSAPSATAADLVMSKDDLMAQGGDVYGRLCAACHQPTGQGMPPMFPSLVGSAVVTGPVAEQLNTVVNGRPGTAMAAFGPQLNDVELAAVLTYQRNSWGNSAGIVQPADVKAAR